MASAKQELKRLCSEINSEGLAVVTVYWNRNFAPDAKDAEGYVEYSKRPQRIFLRKGPEYSFRDIILTLLHEYGHVLDEKRYKGCRRLRLCDKYLFEDTEVAKAMRYPGYVKAAFMHMEYIAEKYISKLLRRFKVELFTKKDVDICNMHTIMTKKYRFIHGKHPSRELRRLWSKQLNKTPKELTLEYALDLTRI